MSSSLSVTLTGRHVTLTPLSIDDVPELVHAASGDRSTFGWSIVPATIPRWMPSLADSSPNVISEAPYRSPRDEATRQRSSV